MKTHPKAGQPVKIANGPLKGKYFVVTDWFTNQYQGKSIEKLMKTQGKWFIPVKRRGFPIDAKLVWGRLYPEMGWCCVHETEILVDLKTVENAEGETVELPPNVEPMLPKGKGKARLKSVGGTSGKKVASKTTEAGSSPATPAKKEESNDPGTAS